MKFFTLRKTSVLAVILTSFSVFSSTAIAQESDDVEKIRAELVKMIPVAQEAEIVPGPVEGVYRLFVQGNYAYAMVKGDFVLLGDLFNTETKINLGDEASKERMAQQIKEVSEEKMIVFGPKDAKRHITVFTDIDCGYCRKLHREVPELNEAGIQVRYLAFPRAGIGSGSHNKFVSVWCNDDQQTALTDAKAGNDVPEATCENPIEESYLLGVDVGVRGTPTIIFDDGTVRPGYVPSTVIIGQLGLDNG